MKKIFSNKINSVIFVNYLFIAYAFCLPLSKNFSNIIFSAIIILFFIDGDIKNKLRFIFTATDSKSIRESIMEYIDKSHNYILIEIE